MYTSMSNLEAAWDMGLKWGRGGYYGSVPNPWRGNPVLKERWKLAQRSGLVLWERNKRTLLVQQELFDV